MKFQAEKFDVQAITGYGPGWLAVDKQSYDTSLIVGSRGLLQPWDCRSFDALTPEHFAALARLEAEVIIFGSGSRIRFISPAWQRPLMEQRIGLETMDTQAACRTYNILASEGRNVIAALLLE